MLLEQVVDEDLGCASYLVGDEPSGEAVLVDPVLAVEPLLERAAAHGLHVVRVLETHTHADHVSGHGRLALEHGLPVSIHAAAAVDYPHDPLADGDEITVGTLRIRTIHTPGHRPEHCCFLAGDSLLTGDSLFVGAAARPDLAVDPREGAEGLFSSLRRLAELPDAVRVLPGHVAGSLCGAHMSPERSSTIARERLANPSLGTTVVDEFVADALRATSIPRPPNMQRIVELNRGPWVGRPAPLEPLSSAAGLLVLDVRDPAAFAAGHVPGALNVPVRAGSFGTRAGFLVRAGERVALYGAPGEVDAAAQRLHAVGFLELAGFLVDVPATESIEPVSLDELERIVAEGAAELVDVRDQDERDAGYIPGSRHVPYRLLRACADGFADRPVVTLCESGARAAIAASILAAAGVPARPVLHGGVHEWERRGGTTIAFRRCGSG